MAFKITKVSKFIPCKKPFSADYCANLWIIGKNWITVLFLTLSPACLISLKKEASVPRIEPEKERDIKKMGIHRKHRIALSIFNHIVCIPVSKSWAKIVIFHKSILLIIKRWELGISIASNICGDSSSVIDINKYASKYVDIISKQVSFHYIFHY